MCGRGVLHRRNVTWKQRGEIGRGNECPTNNPGDTRGKTAVPVAVLFRLQQCTIVNVSAIKASQKEGASPALYAENKTLKEQKAGRYNSAVIFKARSADI